MYMTADKVLTNYEKVRRYTKFYKDIYEILLQPH
jgi:hypothetical protein